MSMSLIKKLRAQRDDLKTGTITPLLTLMEGGDPLTDAQRDALTTADGEVQRLDAQIDSLTGLQSRWLEAAARDAELDRKAEHVATGLTTSTPRPDERVPSFSQAAAEEIVKLGGTGSLTLPRAALSVIDNRDAGGRPLVRATRVRDTAEPATSTPLLDATAKQPVDSDDYEWEEWGLIPVAGDVAAAEGTVKPEAEDGYTIRQGVLGLVAHHIGVSRRALQDRAGLQAKIENRLLRGVDLRAEARAAAALVAGTYDTADHADGLLQAIRIAMAMVQDKGFTPTTLVINPLDQAYIDIGLLNLSPGPGALAGRSIWQLPSIVATSKVPSGTAYVGNIFDAMLTTYRADSQLYMTDSHADEFTRNRVRILAEQRVSVNLQQPNAVVKAEVATP